METVLTEKNFEEEVIKSDKKALIDFWATWCGPCRMIAPEVEKIAKEFDGKIKVLKVNVDEELTLAEKFNIEVIPTLVLIENGEEKKRSSGLMNYQEIIKEFNL